MLAERALRNGSQFRGTDRGHVSVSDEELSVQNKEPAGGRREPSERSRCWDRAGPGRTVGGQTKSNGKKGWSGAAKQPMSRRRWLATVG